MRASYNDKLISAFHMSSKESKMTTYRMAL